MISFNVSATGAGDASSRLCRPPPALPDVASRRGLQGRIRTAVLPAPVLGKSRSVHVGVLETGFGAAGFPVRPETAIFLLLSPAPMLYTRRPRHRGRT
jgi:hypothetical protein